MAGEEKRDVLVLVGKPQNFPDSPDYYCPFQIIGVGDQSVSYTGGVDSIQAIQMALREVGAQLLALNKANGGKLRWEAGGEGDLGLPPPT